MARLIIVRHAESALNTENRIQGHHDSLLTKKGVAQARLETKGLGMSQPVASNETAEGRQKNRRVDLVIRGE